MNEISSISTSKQKIFYGKLQQLLKSRTFNDVTFNCKDGKTRGNRLILSVYSTVLKDVFKDNPLLAEHPKSHPENGIVLLQSSVHDVNNLLNILNSRSWLELSKNSLGGVLDIAKVFDIKLLTKNLENDRISVKAVVQAHKGNDIIESNSTKLKEESNEMKESGTNGSANNSGIKPKPMLQTCKRNLAKAEDKAFEDQVDDEDLNDDDDEEMGDDSEDDATSPDKVNQRARCSSQSSTLSNSSNTNANPKNAASLFMEDKYYWVEHVNGIRTFKCKLCPKSYENVSRIRNHYQVKHLKIIFRCTKCPEKFDTRYNVVKHVKVAHKVKQGWRHFYTHNIMGADES